MALLMAMMLMTTSVYPMPVILVKAVFKLMMYILVGDDTERLTLRLKDVFVRDGGSPICSNGAVNTPDKKS
jgi:hypothetical protein